MLGTVHWLTATAALALALAVILHRKGTAGHRLLGWSYVSCMLALNLAALGIYDMRGEWGAFHWLALVSLLTLVAGMLPAVVRRQGQRRPGWLGYHSHFMAWSAIGLAAAGLSQLAVEIYPGWAAVIVATSATMLMGQHLVSRHVPRAARHAATIGTE